MAEEFSYFDEGVGGSTDTSYDPTGSRYMEADVVDTVGADAGAASPASTGSFNWGKTVGDWTTAAGGVGTLTSGAGTLLSTIGSLMAARQAKKAAEYNAQVVSRNAQAQADVLEIEAQQRERNASIVLQDIFLSRQAQEEQESAQRDQQAYLVSQTRAIIGASGLMMSGSPLAVYEAQLHQSERQILAGRYKADLQERALRDQATMEGYAADVARYGAGERLRVGAGQAKLARYAGAQQAAASRMEAFGGIASGAARTYAQYERAQAQRQREQAQYERGQSLKGPVLRE
jgi:hypothetical protein